MTDVAGGSGESTKAPKGGSDADLAARYRSMMAKSKARSAAHREAQKSKGLVRVALWVPEGRRRELVDVARSMGGSSDQAGNEASS